MRAAWAYFAAWPQTSKDFAELSKTKLTLPVLAIAGEKASASTLFPQMKLVANDVSVVGLNDTGHWLMEERPKDTIEALTKFLSWQRHGSGLSNRQIRRCRSICRSSD